MPDGGLDEPPLSSRRLYILFNSYIVTRRKERRFFSNEAYSRGMREHGEHEGSRGGWRFLEFHVDCDNYSETYTHTYTHTHTHTCLSSRKYGIVRALRKMDLDFPFAIVAVE